MLRTDVRKVLIFSPNGDPDLRSQMVTFANNMFGNVLVYQRVNAFLKDWDLEPADATVILAKDQEVIGSLYAKKGAIVAVFDPGFFTASGKIPPPDPAKEIEVTTVKPLPVKAPKRRGVDVSNNKG
jgi:hypothetical protein